jgi:NTP pyrophosphatase (non-canonical NTP hydrolase)
MIPEEHAKIILPMESKDFESILKRLTTDYPKVRLLHAAIGMGTETGEFQDAIKKYLFYGTPVDYPNLIEELGDLMWYIQVACDVLGVTLGEVLRINAEKLQARYSKGKFDKEDAENRDLEEERKILESKEPKSHYAIVSLAEPREHIHLDTDLENLLTIACRPEAVGFTTHVFGTIHNPAIIQLKEWNKTYWRYRIERIWNEETMQWSVPTTVQEWYSL